MATKAEEPTKRAPAEDIDTRSAKERNLVVTTGDAISIPPLMRALYNGN